MPKRRSKAEMALLKERVKAEYRHACPYVYAVAERYGVSRSFVSRCRAELAKEERIYTGHSRRFDYK